MPPVRGLRGFALLLIGLRVGRRILGALLPIATCASVAGIACRGRLCQALLSPGEIPVLLRFFSPSISTQLCLGFNKTELSRADWGRRDVQLGAGCPRSAAIPGCAALLAVETCWDRWHDTGVAIRGSASADNHKRCSSNWWRGIHARWHTSTSCRSSSAAYEQLTMSIVARHSRLAVTDDCGASQDERLPCSCSR